MSGAGVVDSRKGRTDAGEPVIVEPDGAVFLVSEWAVCDGCWDDDHDHCVMPIRDGVCCCED